MRRTGSFRREPTLRPRISPRRLRLTALFLVSATLIALVNQIHGSWSFDPTMSLHWEEGTLWAGGRNVHEHDPRAGLVRSDLVWSDVDGRGRIEARTMELEIEPETQLLVISAVAQRLRMLEGRLTVRGSGVLETPHGFVELDDGEAFVALAGDGLEVIPMAGVVERVDARGSEVLTP